MCVALARGGMALARGGVELARGGVALARGGVALARGGGGTGPRRWVRCAYAFLVPGATVAASTAAASGGAAAATGAPKEEGHGDSAKYIVIGVVLGVIFSTVALIVYIRFCCAHAAKDDDECDGGYTVPAAHRCLWQPEPGPWARPEGRLLLLG